MPNLPAELIEDILHRLPVKSLKRFRSVAKSWYFLIDSENFIKLHLNRSLISSTSLILGGLGLYSIDLDSLDKARVIKPPFYYKSIDGISNSCNGLVLVMSEPPVLWNIFSRCYKVLPDFVVDDYTVPLDCYSKTAYGFGYDSTNDDYKVVRVVEYRNDFTHVWVCSQTAIYSFRSNSWRRIEGFPYPLRGNWRVHVNGALHTVVVDPDDVVGSVRLMAFSVCNEKHYEVVMPIGVRIREVDVSLDVIGGCLCVICTKRSRVHIWMMKESWIKLLSISPPSIERNGFVKPLVYSRDGDKVLLNCEDKRLLWFDLRNKSVENVPVDGIPFVFYAELCVESLVWFDSGDGVRKMGQQRKKEKKMRNKRDGFLSEGFKLVL